MSSRGLSPGGLRVPRRGKATGTGQYLLLGIVAAIVLVVIMLAVRGGGSKPAVSSLRSSRARESSSVSTDEQAGSRLRRSSRKDRALERSARRTRERRAERIPASRKSTSSVRTERSRTAYGGGIRRSGRQSGVPILNGTDGTSTAVFSTRVVRKGEDIDGRRVVDVGQSSVTVEYRNERYQVKVGEPLYR